VGQLGDKLDFQEIHLRRSEILFKQGSLGRNFYIIKTGLIELQFDGRTRKLLKDGEFFGEIGPLATLPRTATATALAPTDLLEYSPDQFHKMLLNDMDMAIRVFSKFHGRLFQHSTKNQPKVLQTPETQFENFLKHFELKTFPKDSILCVEGDSQRTLYFVRKGRVAIIKSGVTVAEARPGDFVGEISAIYGVPRTATLQTLEPSELLECSGSAVDGILDRFNSFRTHLMDLAFRRMR
jgi:CRP-like cAMP-binding protein